MADRPAASTSPACWIGTSGWTYDSWQGRVYPDGLAAAARLSFYAERFDTVELNASYYRWPADTSFRSWRRRLPPGFAFTVKAPRGLTHAKRLHDPERWIARIRRSLALLGDRLGTFLVQLPPGMARDDARLDYFLGAMPGDIPVAVEFRHDSWHTDAVFDLLSRHGAAYVVISGAGLPCILRATAGFVYVRFHGPDQRYLYGGSYDDAAMNWWADRIAEWRTAGHTVFGYFNNDADGKAFRNALTLKHLLRERGW